MGGEPLLNNDIDKILEYTLEQTKIKQVYLVTSATIMLSDKIIEILSKYPKRAIVYISNYSANIDLLPRLKTKKIIEICSQNNITVNHPSDHLWNPRTPVEYHERSTKENKKYYRSCAAYCVGVHKLPDGGAGLFPCIRAGTLVLRKIGSQTEGKDYCRITENLQKKDILNLHLNEDFDACKYCNFLEDKKKSVLAGIQKESPLNKLLEKEGKMMRDGTIIDAAILESPSSTKEKPLFNNLVGY
jgi:hypothetical protein